ncbi:MAG: hypothetical protein IPH44_10135 [Myxococcales bacterium]|nr:hypothetical protein [Myxococcales bacterium]MBP6848730.1 hypothetical protein [Kofleriaceae bacterium]
MLRILIVAALASAGCGRIGYDPVGDGGDGLAIDPPRATINLSSALQLTARGGAPPYGFAVTAGDGEVDLDGTFVAPARVGATVVTVADAAGALATATITHRGARLFVLGGQVAGAAIDEVLASDDGVTWTLVGHLPAPRDSGAALVWNDRLYYLGGIDAGGASQDNVWASTDGVAWTVVGALPNRAGSLGATVHGRALWIAGGYEAGSYDQVYRSTDGAAWTQVGQLPTARHELDLLSTGGSLFALGGHDAAGFLTDVLVSSDGATWARHGDLTIAQDFASAAWRGPYVLRGGGFGVAIERSTDLATWAPVAPLPGAPREAPGMIDDGTRLLVVGGGAAVLATVDGDAWMTIGALPDARARVAAVTFTPR